MGKSDRGVRFAEEQRAKAKAFRIEKDIVRSCRHSFEPLTVVPDARRVGIRSHSPQMCSCAMCGNPRKFFKGKERITMQERRENASEKISPDD